MFKKIIVNCKEKKYPIIISDCIFEKQIVFKNVLKYNSIFIITDNIVYKLYIHKILKSLKEFKKKISTFVLPSGEDNKSLKNVEKILYKLIKRHHNKKTVVVSFGGGVVCDISGFLSSIYLRGIDFIQVPTTLLAQVDASIGGKNSINHNLGKNMIGSFYHPKCVIINPNFLNTLEKKEISSGISEIIKYAIIFDINFFNWIELNLNSILLLNKKKLNYCIEKCCLLKSKVVSKDEIEKYGLRTLLNLGHTYGHAIEYLTDYTLTHGEAISIGIIMSCFLSKILFGIIKNSEIKRIRNMFLRSNLPICTPKKISEIQILKCMKRDKKNFSYNNFNILVPIRIGKVKLCKNISEKLILKSIKKFNEFNRFFKIS